MAGAPRCQAPVIGEGGRGEQAVAGEECVVFGQAFSCDPGRAVPHLSAQHMCAEAAGLEARAALCGREVVLFFGRLGGWEGIRCGCGGERGCLSKI